MQKKIESFKCMQKGKREKGCEKVDFEYQIEKVDSLVMLKRNASLKPVLFVILRVDLVSRME